MAMCLPPSRAHAPCAFSVPSTAHRGYSKSLCPPTFGDMDSFDYIVVGAGTAGCVVAPPLREDAAVGVLLLEAGARRGPAAIGVPAMWPTLIGGEADWGFETVGQHG